MNRLIKVLVASSGIYCIAFLVGTLYYIYGLLAVIGSAGIVGSGLALVYFTLRAAKARYSTAESQRRSGLKDAWIDVGAGEFVAILGSSGSGKSSLLNISSSVKIETARTPADTALILPGESVFVREGGSQFRLPEPQPVR